MLLYNGGQRIFSSRAECFAIFSTFKLFYLLCLMIVCISDDISVVLSAVLTVDTAVPILATAGYPLRGLDVLNLFIDLRAGPVKAKGLL